MAGARTWRAEGVCSLLGQGLREVGVGWNLGPGGGISPRQVEDRPFLAAGRAGPCAELVGGVAGR